MPYISSKLCQQLGAFDSHTRQHFQLWGAARVNPFTGMQLAERRRECSFAPLSLQKRASMGVSPSAHTEGFWEDHNRPSGWFPFTASWYLRSGRCCVGVSPCMGEISPNTGRTPGFDRETTAEIKCQCGGTVNHESVSLQKKRSKMTNWGGK